MIDLDTFSEKGLTLSWSSASGPAISGGSGFHAGDDARPTGEHAAALAGDGA